MRNFAPVEAHTGRQGVVSSFSQSNRWRAILFHQKKATDESNLVPSKEINKWEQSCTIRRKHGCKAFACERTQKTREGIFISSRVCNSFWQRKFTALKHQSKSTEKQIFDETLSFYSMARKSEHSILWFFANKKSVMIETHAAKNILWQKDTLHISTPKSSTEVQPSIHTGLKGFKHPPPWWCGQAHNRSTT